MDMNTGVPNDTWVEFFPILGYFKSGWYFLRGHQDLASKEFKRATRNTGVIFFGIEGGLLFGLNGSVAGGIIGGVIADFLLTNNPDGYKSYAKKLWNRNMEEDDWSELLLLIFKDECIAYTNFKIYKTIMDVIHTSIGSSILESEQDTRRRLTYVSSTQKEREVSNTITGHVTGIKCYSDACEKPDFEQEDYMYETEEAMLQKLKQTFNEQPIGKRIKVCNISELQPGNHIIYNRGLYDHHAIVGEVFPESRKYTAYEQSSPSTISESLIIGKASIKENEKNFKSSSLFKIDYGDSAIPRGEVKKMAHFICHHATSCNSLDFDKTYNVLSNNCEHFANFCATGIHTSYQIESSFTPKIVSLTEIFDIYMADTIDD